MFALVIIAMTGAAILQIVAPEYMGSNAAYGISTGWQREIGGIGTNHFIHFLSAHESVNLVGAIENYVLAVGWMIGWKLECNRRKTAGATE